MKENIYCNIFKHSPFKAHFSWILYHGLSRNMLSGSKNTFQLADILRNFSFSAVYTWNCSLLFNLKNHLHGPVFPKPFAYLFSLGVCIMYKQEKIVYNVIWKLLTAFSPQFFFL